MCWHCREYDRFHDGTYKRVPWERETWAATSATVDHYVHVSRHDPLLVAYTASAEHGEADRQTRIAPGRYLTRFYGDVLTQKDIQYWCGRFKGENKDEIELKFASTPDDIVWVYENGPNSCMSGGADRFDADGYHPACVYGAGDLAVAYILNDGRVTARAVCWPEKKIYGRTYGDGDALSTKLRAAGYAYGDESDFDGARLLRIKCSNGFVCPYLDVGSYRRVEDNGEYLIVGCGSLNAGYTGGCISLGPLCPCCEEHYAEYDGCYVYDVGEYWCPSCAEDTTHCAHCDRRHTGEHLIRVRGGDTVCEQCLARSYEHCEVCDEYHDYDDEPCVVEDEEADLEAVPCPTITDNPRQGAFL